MAWLTRQWIGGGVKLRRLSPIWPKIQEMPKETHSYSNGEVTVIWRPKVCIHSAKCALGLPQVFQPREKPWIKIDQATTEQIKAQVDQCPSGALSWVPVHPGD